jgi:hypothetical protein
MKLVLFILAACICLIGCHPVQKVPTQVAPVEKPQTPFTVQIDDTLMPPSNTRLPFEIYAKAVLHDAAVEKGVPLNVWKVRKACKSGPDERSSLWDATCSVKDVDDIDTLKCTGNILIQIPFVKMVGNRDFQIFKSRRCGNTGYVPSKQPQNTVSPRK